MTMSTHRTDRFSRGAAAVAATALRVALALAGFVLALGALLVGLVLSASVIVWALYRGRRPLGQLFRERHYGMRGGFPSGSSAPSQASRGEVVDVAVREVPPAESRLP
jgi:hypothetical protein